jgi:hypothetical protein
MASVTLTLANRCAGGNHLRFELTGARSVTVREDLSNILEPITDDDLAVFVKCVVRLVRIGKTNAQAIAALQAGVVISV